MLVQERVVVTLTAWLDRQRNFREAGGIFIGSYRGPHIEVIDCTVPMPADVRKRTLFDRRDDGHQMAAMSAWMCSGGTESYVGEWHTHPEFDPHYSTLDKGTWNTLMLRARDPLIFAIGGWRSWWWAKAIVGHITKLELQVTTASTAKGHL